MTTFARRVIGAAVLDSRIYEEVEADGWATGQAVAVVLLVSFAAGIGLLRLGGATPQALVAGVIGALVGWMARAALTYLIGTRLLPEPQTRANVGELLRTLAFASAPGLLCVLGLVPLFGIRVYAVGSILDAPRHGRRGPAGSRLHEHGPGGRCLRRGMGAFARDRGAHRHCLRHARVVRWRVSDGANENSVKVTRAPRRPGRVAARTRPGEGAFRADITVQPGGASAHCQ